MLAKLSEQTIYSLLMSLPVFVLSFVGLLFFLARFKGARVDPLYLTALVAILVIPMATALAFIRYEATPAVVGLLGTIVGYAFGAAGRATTSERKEDRATTSEHKGIEAATASR